MEGNGNAQSGNPNIISEQKNGDDAVPQEQQQSEEQIAIEGTTPRRTPFTNLSQVDADLALARRLQEQERAYMMLRMNDGVYGQRRQYFSVAEDDEDDFDDAETENEEDTGAGENISDIHTNEGNNDDTHLHDSFDDEQVDNEAEASTFDVHVDLGDDVDYDDENEDEYEEDEDEDNIGVVFDPELYPTDEAYARALQDHEEREMAARLFAIAGIHDLVADVEDGDNHGGIPPDMWEEEDPDDLSYEELIALGEVVGTESRGLSADTIASLPSIDYKSGSCQTGNNDSCVICRLDYEEGETLTLLSCKHTYHSECINNWLKINKVCPVCSAEVTTSVSNLEKFD